MKGDRPSPGISLPSFAPGFDPRFLAAGRTDDFRFADSLRRAVPNAIHLLPKALLARQLPFAPARTRAIGVHADRFVRHVSGVFPSAVQTITRLQQAAGN